MAGLADGHRQLLSDFAPNQRARVRALDAVHRGSGRGALRDHQIVDALVANGMLKQTFIARVFNGRGMLIR